MSKIYISANIWWIRITVGTKQVLIHYPYFELKYFVAAHVATVQDWPLMKQQLAQNLKRNADCLVFGHHW